MMKHDDQRMSELVHEMRNQLAVAKANVEAIIDGKLSPTAQRLESVVQTLHHLDGLIDDLRGLRSAPSGDAHAITLSEINVCDMLHHEFAAVQAVALEKGITMSVYSCPHQNAACQRFIGDPTRIGQIIDNVLLNAVRYTPRGGRITVDCRRRADELQVTISDDGPGVAPEDASRIFEAGFRSTAGAVASGSGLGLSVVKRFVEGLGGSIKLDPTNDRGARFVVRLPGKLPHASNI